MRTLCKACGASRSAYYAWAAKGDGPSEAMMGEAQLAKPAQ